MRVTRKSTEAMWFQIEMGMTECSLFSYQNDTVSSSDPLTFPTSSSTSTTSVTQTTTSIASQQPRKTSEPFSMGLSVVLLTTVKVCLLVRSQAASSLGLF